jgi:tetratricopeptide (TPR) repeat protein
MNLAECHFSVGNYKAAGYYYEQAFKYRRNYLLDRDNAKCCILAGIAQYRSGNIIQAERFFGYSIPAAKHANSNYYFCVGTSNMALVQLVQGRSAKAIELSNDSLDTAKELFTPNSPEVRGTTPSSSHHSLSISNSCDCRSTCSSNPTNSRPQTPSSRNQSSVQMVFSSSLHLPSLTPAERAVLRAGIASILQDYDKAITILKEAEALRAEIASAQSSIPTLPPIISPRDSDAPADSSAMTLTQSAQSNLGGQGRLAEGETKLDNAKKKEFSYRELMASCLVASSLPSPSLLPPMIDFPFLSFKG